MTQILHPQKDKHIPVHVHIKHFMCEVLYTVQSAFEYTHIGSRASQKKKKKDGDKARIFNPIL